MLMLNPSLIFSQCEYGIINNITDRLLHTHVSFYHVSCPFFCCYTLTHKEKLYDNHFTSVTEIFSIHFILFWLSVFCTSCKFIFSPVHWTNYKLKMKQNTWCRVRLQLGSIGIELLHKERKSLVYRWWTTGNNTAFQFSTGFIAEQQENKDIRIVHKTRS